MSTQLDNSISRFEESNHFGPFALEPVEQCGIGRIAYPHPKNGRAIGCQDKIGEVPVLGDDDASLT